MNDALVPTQINNISIHTSWNLDIDADVDAGECVETAAG